MKTNEWVKWGKTFEELVYFIGEHEDTENNSDIEAMVVVRSGGDTYFVGGTPLDWNGFDLDCGRCDVGFVLADSAIVDEYMIIA